MYNLGDNSILSKQKFMSRETFAKSIDAIAEYSRSHHITRVGIALHGGEPLLMGLHRFADFCELTREGLGEDAVIAIQTNGTLLNEEWVKLFARYGILVGVSIDGPAVQHDRHRKDHKGQGTYNAAVRGYQTAKRASSAGIIKEVSIISVIDPTEDPEEYYSWLKNDLAASYVSVLPPDANHDNIDEHYHFSIDQMSNYLISLFEIWWNSTDNISIRLYENIVTMLLGGHSNAELVGSTGATTVVIDIDGDIQIHDVARTCEESQDPRINVHTSSIDSIFSQPGYLELNPSAEEMADDCQNCAVFRYCQGGFVTHRYSNVGRYRNPSVYCSAWFNLITHVYFRLLGSDPAIVGRSRAKVEEVAVH
ncbi:radical SAM protein [Mesorhizobium sp. M0520]